MGKRICWLIGVILFQRIVGCARQQVSEAELQKRMERQIRNYAGSAPDAKITIGKRTASEFSNYYSVPVTIQQGEQIKTFTFYLSKDLKKMMYVNSFDLTQDLYASVRKKIDLSGRPERGARDAKVTIVVYDDFQCPFCAKFYVTLMNEVMNRYRDQVRVVMKDFPIVDAHPWAMHAAVNANCLLKQDQAAYWMFADYVHTHLSAMNEKYKQSGFAPLDQLTIEMGEKAGIAPEPLKACITAQDTTDVRKSLAEANGLNAGATPGIFVNGAQMEGALTAAQLQTAIEQALADEKQSREK